MREEVLGFRGFWSLLLNKGKWWVGRRAIGGQVRSRRARCGAGAGVLPWSSVARRSCPRRTAFRGACHREVITALSVSFLSPRQPLDLGKERGGGWRERGGKRRARNSISFERTAEGRAKEPSAAWSDFVVRAGAQKGAGFLRSLLL